MLSHGALTEAGLELVDQVAQATGAKLICDTFTPKLARGEGRCEVERLGYFAEQALVQLEDAEQMIMVATKAPVGFFAYPGKPSEFYPAGCMLHTLADVDQDPLDALTRLVEKLGAEAAQPTPNKITKTRFSLRDPIVGKYGPRGRTLFADGRNYRG